MIKGVLQKLQYVVKFQIFKAKWRKINVHNYTTVKKIFPIEKVTVGKKTYGTLLINSYGNQNEKLVIGSYCSIAGNVKFLLGGEHSYKGLSTYPFKKYICGLEEVTYTKGPIIIKDDVWIGEGSLILSGVTIGQGAIIAAGSIVSKNIPPYAIFAGGEIKKYRFSDNIIERLLKINYVNLTEKEVRDNIEFLYSNFEAEMLDSDFFKQLIK